MFQGKEKNAGKKVWLLLEKVTDITLYAVRLWNIAA
jgi:hypothetical protein